MLEFNGQRWIVDECSLNVALPLHPQNLPEVWWSMDVSARPQGACHDRADLRVAIDRLFAPVRDWRELQNLDLNIDARWQDAHEFVNEDGEVQWTEIEARWWPDRSINKACYWLGDEFLIRFGSLEAGRLICEVEGLLEAEERYYRDPPAVAPHTSNKCQAPARLLLMGQVGLHKCEIEVPGDVREPLAWAQARAARTLGFREFRSSHVRSVGGTPDAPVRAWKVTLLPNFNR